MKLLFDHNLSPRLISRLSDLYPDASHVSLVGLDRSTDTQVWEYARANGYDIVTKDSDFNDIAVLRGPPPKVVWLRVGNCTTSHIEQVLRTAHQLISDFARDPSLGIVEVQ